MTTRIAFLGEYRPTFPPHPATQEACAHSAAALGAEVEAEWVATGDITINAIGEFDGIWVAPGSPYQSLENTLAVIRHARETGVPCFGTCGGCQHIIIEYARNVLGFRDAQHAEYDPYASELFISELICSLAGRPMQLELVRGSRVAVIYGGASAI